ncbi:MAG: hypothetical protein KJO07_15725 [Deltaproteobacteria bacterium]|nr:hypothetical protein [Deltaproteobacteria bacterium]
MPDAESMMMIRHLRPAVIAAVVLVPASRAAAEPNQTLVFEANHRYTELLGFRLGTGLVDAGPGLGAGMRLGTIRWGHLSWTALDFELQASSSDLPSGSCGPAANCSASAGFFDASTHVALRAPWTRHDLWIGMGTGFKVEASSAQEHVGDVGLIVAPSIEYVYRTKSSLLLGLDLRVTKAVSGKYARTPMTITVGARAGFDLERMVVETQAASVSD